MSVSWEDINRTLEDEFYLNQGEPDPSTDFIASLNWHTENRTKIEQAFEVANHLLCIMEQHCISYIELAEALEYPTDYIREIMTGRLFKTESERSALCNKVHLIYGS